MSCECGCECCGTDEYDFAVREGPLTEEETKFRESSMAKFIGSALLSRSLLELSFRHLLDPIPTPASTADFMRYQRMP